MSESYSVSESETFTIAHARKIASKVATDLLRFKTLYGSPSDRWIDDYEAEMVQLLKHDVVDHVVYGFKRNGKWTDAAVRYKAQHGGTLVTDDDPGKIRPRFDIADAFFTSFLSYNSNWRELTPAERDAIEQGCPFQRSSGEAPPLESGYWKDDLSYTAGGRGFLRSTVAR